VPKVRVSVTIDKRFLEWIDKKVEELVFANRSHALEYAIKHLIDEEQRRATNP